MTPDASKSFPTASPALPPRSGMAHFLAWCSAAPLLLLVVQLSYFFTERDVGDKLVVVLAFVVGCVALVVAALTMGAARRTLAASLAGVLIGIPVAVLGYLVALNVYDQLIRWAG